MLTVLFISVARDVIDLTLNRVSLIPRQVSEKKINSMINSLFVILKMSDMFLSSDIVSYMYTNTYQIKG